jgi:DNA-binding NarL/FixJ family response regulator
MEALSHMPLSNAQLALLQSCVEANTKATRQKASHNGALSARDDLIRQALAGGVTETAIARALKISRAMVWKIKNGLTTDEAAERNPKKKGKTKP